MLEALFNSITARIVITAATCNVACALVGCFLVLRRMSLMGDALSHAVLPGLVIALLVSPHGGALVMMLGAVGAGLTTTFLTSVTEKHGRVAADASLGVVYTTLFALGVVLVKRNLADVHFDFACIYEGSLLTVAMDTVTVAGGEVPRSLLVALPVLCAVVAIFALLWKEWKVSTFDAPLAGTMGFAPGAMHYLLMTMVSVTVMTAFEAIGSILVIAMLIAPAAAAQVLTDRLSTMLMIAAGLAVAATVLGNAAAEWLNVSPSGCIAAAAGLLYATAALFGPQHGIVSRMVQHAQLAVRVRREDLLARLYRRHESPNPEPVTIADAEAIADGGWFGHRAVKQLLRRGEAVSTPRGLTLTDQGLSEGRRLVRTHRLWESYLVQEVGLPTDHVHDPAHRVEHFLDEKIDEEILRELEVAEDPHGREIPGRDEESGEAIRE